MRSKSLSYDAHSDNLIKQVEIGAGAIIKQKIGDDPNDLSYWEDEPVGMIYINYCDQATKDKILASGKRKEVSEGFMASLSVGN
ncbi:MAG: hypothetical protein HC836_47075 [Richelia sp. RM2_1_2]|nr:hypothetical protein [Richelia sp. RM2_1_2]